MTSISAKLADNKAKALVYLQIIPDGMECDASPLHYLKDNDAIVDYICYLSLPPWKKEEFKKANKAVKLPGGDAEK